MLFAYSPALRKPSKNSADWYRSFHSIFYLSQVTNLTLLSYMDSFIHQDKEAIIESLKDELIEKKILKFDKHGQTHSIAKESELCSIHIEDTIRFVIEKTIKENIKKNKILLFGMGLNIDGYEEKEIEIDLDDLLNSTSSKNWYDALRGLLNVWEFLFLYSIVESTLKSILGKEGVTREEELMPNIFKFFENLEVQLGVPKSAVFDLWIFFTELRNIYAHGHGLITKTAKSNLGGKLNNAKNAIPKFYEGGILIGNTEKLFSKETIKENKFFFLKDEELNVFRNLIINIIECMDQTHQTHND